MKKNLIITIALCLFTFGLGLSFNNVALSNVDSSKIAYVNVSKILLNSKSFKAAQNSKQEQERDLIAWFKKANEDINKQTTSEGKNVLVKKYEAQLNQKKKTINDNYVKKVNEIDTQISNVISQKATALGYQIVLKKDAVVFGGVDITDNVIPSVK